MPREKQYTEEDIIEMLRRTKDKEGKCTPRVFNARDDTCSAGTVMRRFGSWTGAKEEAGIDEDVTGDVGVDKTYSDEQLLQHLRELKRREGSVSIELLGKDEHSDLASSSAMARRFDSWSDAVEQAGVGDDTNPIPGRPQEYSEEDLLRLLRMCDDEHGKVTQRVFNEDDMFPSPTIVRQRFGSWSEAKSEAGLDSDHRKKYDKDEMLELLQKAAEEIDGNVSANKLSSHDGSPAPETYQRKFGTWSEAKDKAGVE